MADAFQWAGLLPGPPQSPVTAEQQGSAFGLDMGQKLATLNALRGVDFSDPNSVNSSIEGSIHAGALDQANALMNLNFTRQMRQSIPAFQAELAGALGGQPQQAPASAPPSPQPTPPQTVDPRAHLTETYGLAKGAADQLLSTPLDDRPAAFQKIKQDMIARGLPPEAVESFGQDLSDAHLKSASDYFGGLQAHAGGADGATMPAAHPSSNWYMNLLNRPDLIAGIDAMKAVGYDLTPLVTQAQALAQPEIAKQADEAHAGNIAAEIAAAQRQQSGQPVELTMGDGSKVQVTPDQARTLMQTVPGMFHGPGLEGAAAASARGTAEGGAPFKFEDVPEIDAHGMPTGRTIRVSQAQEAATTAQGGVVGRSQSPAETEFSRGQAGALNDTVKQASDPIHIQDLQNKANTAQTVIGLANNIKSGKFTGDLSQLNQVLSSLGVGGQPVKDYASASTMLDAALNKEVSSELSGSKNVRNEREFNLLKSPVGSFNDPADKLRYQAALVGSLNNQQQAYGKFAAAYADDPNTTKSQAALDQAWQHAHGEDSVFADPIWQSVKLFGKPAVTIDKQPDAHGHVWGYLGLGTPLQRPFLVK